MTAKKGAVPDSHALQSPETDTSQILPGVDLASWWLMARALREQMIGAAAACDPPWYILLDLYRARGAGRKVQITSLSPMIGAPHSTAGRWARQLIAQGLLAKSGDPDDRRRAYVELSPSTLCAMRAYFEELATRGGAPPQIREQLHGPG